MSAVIRKIVTVVEETHIEMGKTIAPPTRRAAAIAVIENPFAGKYVEDLSPLIAIGEELGELLSKRAVAALGIDGAKAQSYGKAAAVGENGELEHAAAILHPKMGAPVRKVLSKGAALIPSSKKRGGPGTTLDIPLGHKDAAFVRSHFDGMEVQINDAPRANEIMVAVAVTDSGRPLARLGGLLVGTFLSNIGLAVSDFANQKKVFFLAAEPLTDAITWSKGNRYTFRLRPSNYMQAAMLVEAAAKLPAKRWATIAPNYEYGQSAVAVFKKLMSEKRPDIQWVDEQWPPQGKIDAGPVVQAVAAANPEAILNVTFGADLVKLVREGNTRGLFKDRAVVSFLTGEPEYLDPLKEETPEGWIVTGYPWYGIKMPEHDAFLKAYQAKYNDYPRLGSIVGYQTIKSAAAILAKANSTDPEKLIAATEGLSVPTPFGEITFRKIDHQSTLGAYVGKTALKEIGRAHV